MIGQLIPYEWLRPEEERNVVEFIMSIDTTIEVQRELLLEWAQEAGVEVERVEEVIARWRP